MQVFCLAGGPVLTNSYVIADDGGNAAVIDPGFEPESLAREIDCRGWRVELIIATHGHFDHVAGNRAARELWGVPLVMHPAAVPVATTASEHARWFGMVCEDSPAPDRTVDDGDVLRIGELELEVRHTPGHSPGGISLYTPGHVVVGDALFAGSIGRVDLPHSDPQLLMDSIRLKLMSLPDETIVYPGHGEQTTIGRERRTNPFRVHFGGER